MPVPGVNASATGRYASSASPPNRFAKPQTVLTTDEFPRPGGVANARPCKPLIR